MQDLMMAWPGLLIAFLEFVLGALWVFASVLQRRKTGFILLAVGTLGSSALIASEQVYRVTVMLHHAPGVSAAQIGAAIGWGALVFLCLRTACFALMIVGASFLAFAARREAPKPGATDIPP
jgi:uncharacterized membrane protein